MKCIVILAMMMYVPVCMATSWSGKVKETSETAHKNRVNPNQFTEDDETCAKLKVLNAAHTQHEKESFHESMALLALLSKEDIKKRVRFIPKNILKQFLGEMESTYVWMDRASNHKKTDEAMRKHLKNTILPRAKYLVNAISETLNDYKRATQVDEQGNLVSSSLRRHSGSSVKGPVKS